MKTKRLARCVLFSILAAFAVQAHGDGPDARGGDRIALGQELHGREKGTVPFRGRVILDTHFGIPGKAFEEIVAAKGIRITGSLPEGWGDNSNWKNNVVAEYKPVSENGQRFLRVRQTSGDGLQFMHGLPGLEKEGGYYRLTCTAQCHGRQPRRA